MANRNRGWYVERKESTSPREVGYGRFQSVADDSFHFVGLVSSVHVSTTESVLPHAGVRCFMGGSRCRRPSSNARVAQTLRMVSHRGTKKTTACALTIGRLWDPPLS